ncbi:MAG TPA: chorismate mutase [Gemmatimonadaceae bacterium]|nr:chorismate mutase [Gemmatimonadaceae bacterium]
MSERHVRAIRGATTVEADDPTQIRSATRELLEHILERNQLSVEHVISAIFSVTADLTSDFPAHAARALGWLDVPLLCTMEIPVPGALPHCIRVLLHVESTEARRDIAHVYLREARGLRPDLQ